MTRIIVLVAASWLSVVVALTGAFDAGSSTYPQQGGRARGAKVTFESLRKGGDGPHSERARLLSLAVERGETPTPFLAPGGFRATFETVVTLPARDRVRFRLAGRGRAKLLVNGKQTLDGVMRGRRPLETDKPIRLRKGENDLKLVFESSAMGDGELRLFWSGYDFGFEPIAPELLSFAADDEQVARGEQLRLGHQLFAERRCARCHEYDQKRVAESAYSDLDRGGPDLRGIAGRVHAGWLVRWMQDPRALRSHVSMPRFSLSEQDAKDVAAYLAGLGTAAADTALTAKQAEAGAVRFFELGCVACHVAPKGDPADAELGDRIALGFVGQKWRATALVAYLQQPARHHPDVRMPNLKVTVDEARELAAYLLQDAQPATGPTGDAKAGRRLVRKHGCVLCHLFDEEIPPVDRIFPRYRSLDDSRGCLSDELHHRGAPDHAFSDEQRAALRAFLPHAADAPFRRAPTDFFARHFASDRCYACHALDGERATWQRVVEQASQQTGTPLPKEQDPSAQGVPSLTWTGGKLQPSWIRAFVGGELGSPRPWLTARMPAFERHGAAITAGLVREHGYGSRDEPVRPGDAQLAIHGERLIANGTGFGCVQCHALGDKPATQVFEREGIELTLSRKRLRHEYYTRWLADPPRLDPESRMTKFANSKGKTAFTDVLDGDATRQFEAIWQYLGGLSSR